MEGNLGFLELHAGRIQTGLGKLAFRFSQGNTLLVTCKQGELEVALQADITLAGLDIRNWDVALSSALLYLDTNEVVHLARGKAIFRAAMRIELNPEARRRQFSKADYAELALHYKDKIVQVHVMAEYARLAVRKVQAAMGFVIDYFSLERAEFVRRYFAGRKEILEIATTEAAHRRILTSLANPDQQAIVAAPQDGNYLVLAGPGAGKTRVIVHRVAWLLRESMALPEQILVLAYNRSAATEIRRRLWSLIGADAAGVAVQTLHSLAMRLTGTSYAVALERGETVDFGAVIRHATERLRAAEQGDGVGPSVARDRLLAGLRFLLVDEYQDINGDHYALISALAGRNLQTEEDRLALMVVGDDEPNRAERAGSGGWLRLRGRLQQLGRALWTFGNPTRAGIALAFCRYSLVSALGIFRYIGFLLLRQSLGETPDVVAVLLPAHVCPLSGCALRQTPRRGWGSISAL